MSGRQRSGDLLLIVRDENIASEDLQSALTPVARAAGARVDLHTTHFPRETKDPVWMPIAAARHWAVISCDVSSTISSNRSSRAIGGSAAIGLAATVWFVARVFDISQWS